MLATFKTTLDQQKMQSLQPQIAKLQQKYPNSNTNNYEKQRLAQEQMNLYKQNKIHPFGQFIVLFFQFPIFICVWSALQGSSALSSGEFLNLRLSDTIKDTLFNFSGTWYYNTSGWWTALILFLLMNEKIFFDGVISYKLLAKKEVGQNFLADPTTAKRIVDLLELQTSDHVLEIGSGAGSLSFFLAEAPSESDLIDIDEALVTKLQHDFAGNDHVHPQMGNAMVPT